jgi:HEAT repeat protein
MGEDELRAALTSADAGRRFVAVYVVGERRLPWPTELIERLTDPSPPVRQAARRSLVILSFLELNPDESLISALPAADNRRAPRPRFTPPVDFGPSPTANQAGRAAAARKWSEWWAQRQAPHTLRSVALDSPSGDAADTRAEAHRLAAEFAKAEPARQRDVLRQYGAAKGAEYSQALALIIDGLSGEFRREARETFAERMARMTVATLGGYLREGHPEVRRAALLGLAMRDSTAHVPRMIELLGDADPRVERAAYGALRSLSGQDFVPRLNATQQEKEGAIGRWLDWWKAKNPARN